MTSTTVSTSSVSVTVGEVGAQVLLTDMATYGDGNPAVELGTVLGNAIATKIDTDLIALFDGFSGSIGTAGAEITVADSVQGCCYSCAPTKVTGTDQRCSTPLSRHTS